MTIFNIAAKSRITPTTILVILVDLVVKGAKARPKSSESKITITIKIIRWALNLHNRRKN